jgi:hypothetical protein
MISARPAPPGLLRADGRADGRSEHTRLFVDKTIVVCKADGSRQHRAVTGGNVEVVQEPEPVVIQLAHPVVQLVAASSNTCECAWGPLGGPAAAEEVASVWQVQLQQVGGGAACRGGREVRARGRSAVQGLTTTTPPPLPVTLTLTAFQGRRRRGLPADG